MNDNLVKQLEPILKCPQTDKRLLFNEIGKKLIVENNNIEYSIIDDIIDFIPEETQEYIDRYAKRAKRYEKLFKKPSILVRLLDKIIWGIKHEGYSSRVVDFIPKNFEGILLDVPVGTGILTLDKYKQLPRATIIVVDYSFNMINFAKKRFIENTIKNVIYLHADVGKLPLGDQTIDGVISMNGYHTFPDKDKAMEEIARVLKPKGQFIGCFYIKEQRKITDKFVQGYYTRKGWFVPPYYTLEGVFKKYGQFFSFKTIKNIKSMIYFNSQKLA